MGFGEAAIFLIQVRYKSSQTGDIKIRSTEGGSYSKDEYPKIFWYVNRVAVLKRGAGEIDEEGWM
jgi:hypothetical protein